MRKLSDRQYAFWHFTGKKVRLFQQKECPSQKKNQNWHCGTSLVHMIHFLRQTEQVLC